jgi:hypothetical protein
MIETVAVTSQVVNGPQYVPTPSPGTAHEPTVGR